MAVSRTALTIALVGVVAIAGLFLYTRVRGGAAQQSSAGQQQAAPAADKSADKPSTSKSSAPKEGSGTKSQTPQGKTQTAPDDQSQTPGKPRSAGTVTPESLPKPLSIALAAHVPVVVLFYLPDGADDRAVRRNIKSVPLRRVGYFEVPISRVARYSRLATQVGLNSSPTLVVVNARHRAMAVSGYLDSGSIEQIIRDGTH